MSQVGAGSSGIFYGWYVLMAAFLVYTIGHGVQFSFGVFLKPLSETFRWSRSLTAGAFMLYMICRGVSSIVVGGLTDRYGPRPIVALGGLLMGMGMLLGSIMSTIWELYLFYGILAGVGMGVVTVPLSATVSRWFFARRDLAQGMVVSGSGVANLIISPMAGYLILGFGLSWAYLVMGSGSLILICLSALFLRKEPSDLRLKPYGAEMEPELGHQEIQTSQVLRSRSFWLLATVAFIFGICYYMLMTNIVAYATDREIPKATAPYLLSIIGASNTIGYVVMSLVTEGISARRTLALCLGIQAVMLFWLTGVSSLVFFCFIAAVLGFSVAGVILPLLLMPPTFFGLKSLGSILGIVLLIHILGGAVGSELGNVIYDFTDPHSYSPAFFLGGALYVVAMILALIMKKPSHHFPYAFS